MSYSIKGTDITMTRGDTLKATITLTLNGEKYTPASGDSIRFAVKHQTKTADKSEYADASPLITKDIPTNTMTLTLSPSDTKSLGFGKYVYDIQVTFADGTVDTVIPEALFKLTPEVD